MAEPQQVEDEVQQAKSAEDRKAAAAMSRLDARDDDGSSANVDSEAASKAMKSLGDASATAKADAAKKVKIDAADVALLVDQLDLTKPKATELLKSHDGDAVAAMKAFITVA